MGLLFMMIHVSTHFATMPAVRPSPEGL